MKNGLDVLRHPLVISAFVLSTLIVVGAYFGFHWYYGEVEPVPEELLSYTPEPAVGQGDPEGRLSWTEESATRRVSIRSDDAVQTETETDNSDDLEYTPVYYFPDGTPVPEHLLCPEKWIGVYMEDLDAQESTELAEHMRKVADEVIANYNLNRPVAEVWGPFIESERQYREEAIQDNRSGLSIGGGKLDIQYEQIYNFPEIIKLGEEDHDRFFNMFMVDRGNYQPDWNLHTLPDGREFRTKDGYRYEFHYTSFGNVDPEGSTEIYDRTFRVSQSEGGELIVVDLNETSDEELGRIGGWNYNYNPYTGQ